MKIEKNYGNCLACAQPLKVSKRKYCNNTCQQKYQTAEKLKSGKFCKRFLKRHITEIQGHICNNCGIVDWQGKSIVLELEHKDGNSENDKIDNLCLLCPNCHSQTETYKNKNRGNGRHSRRQRYAEGKSF